VSTVHGKSECIRNDVSAIWLGVDGPSRVQFVFVNDNRGRGRQYWCLATAEETPTDMQLRYSPEA
jgi:hypothetical protein